jgi:alanine dehydrogenase
MSLILTGTEVMQILDMDLALRAAHQAFLAYGQGRVNMPPKSYLQLAQGDFRAMYGEIFLESGHLCGLKWVNVHPRNPERGLPTVMAKILLNDPDSGLEWADLDGTHITNFRTGAAGGLAARYLSRPESFRLGLIGAGEQARTQVAALLKVRPLREVTIYSRTPARAQALKDELTAAYDLEVKVAKELAEAVQGMDILATTTPSTVPLVPAAWVAQGTHINAIGADAAGKQELAADLLQRARIVVDDWAQASHSGEINVPLARGEIRPEEVYGPLGDIVAGKKPGRETPAQITVFDSTGLIIQDLALGFAVYQQAHERGLGEEKKFL